MSFRRVPAKSTSVSWVRDCAGIRPSPAGFPVTSFGVEGLDTALCGGLPLGSLTVLVEDFPTANHDYFVRIFLAQGLAHGHAVALAQQHAPPAASFAALPRPRVESSSGVRPLVEVDSVKASDVTIAWRYLHGSSCAGVEKSSSNVVSGNGGNEVQYRHAFDLSDTMEVTPDHLVSHLGYGSSTCLNNTLRDIMAHIRSGKRRNRVARVVVAGVQSGIWDESHVSVSAFVHQLRILAEFSQAVVLVTVPSDSLAGEVMREADIVLRLETYGGLGAKVAGLGSDWLGVVSVEKAYRPPGYLKSVRPPSKVWVFKRSRRKYIVEPAAAAPEFEEASSASADKRETLLSACAAGGTTTGSLDF